VEEKGVLGGEKTPSWGGRGGGRAGAIRSTNEKRTEEERKFFSETPKWVKKKYEGGEKKGVAKTMDNRKAAGKDIVMLSSKRNSQIRRVEKPERTKNNRKKEREGPETPDGGFCSTQQTGDRCRGKERVHRLKGEGGP